mgnify:CR=1 FL=1
MDQGKNHESVNKIARIAGFALFALAWGALLAGAVTQYPPGSLLQPNDVTSSHIRNRTIVGVDISTSAEIQITNATTTNATTTSLYVIGWEVVGSSTIASLNVQNLTSTSTANFNAATFAAFPTLPSGSPVNSTDAANKSYADSVGGTVKLQMTAGQKLMARTPAFVASSTITGDDQGNPDGATANTTCQIGANGERAAQGFKVSRMSLATSAQLLLKQIGTPTDSITVEIQTDSAGLPSNTAVASTSTAPIMVGADYASTTWTFIDPVVLAPNTQYWLVFKCNVTNNTNYYGFRYNSTGNPYADGPYAYWNGSIWTTGANADIQFFVNAENIELDRVYAANGANSMTASTTIGFINGETASSSLATLTIGGAMSGFSGLATAGWQWLQNNSTSTGATAGTFPYRMGIAVSSTTILLMPDLLK